jgi:hypothetical protein
MKKVIKSSFYLIIILLVVFSCCKKSNTAPNLLKGKIKRIQETLIAPDLNYHLNLQFFYDSIDGALRKITLGNKLYVEISKKTNNYFILDYDVSVRDSTTTPNRVKIKAYIDNNGYINKIIYVDSALNPLQDLLDIYITNGYPDSIREFFLNSKHYDFQFQDGNITQSVHDYINFFSQNYKITTNYKYTNKINTNILPFQNDILTFYRVSLSTYSTSPLYILGLNGYFPFRSNHNLLDSLKNVENNRYSKYEYSYNALNEINRMKIYDSTKSATFDIEYY